jgi:C4-dicarboxylate-specific signal transduction histidine kinase
MAVGAEALGEDVPLREDAPLGQDGPVRKGRARRADTREDLLQRVRELEGRVAQAEERRRAILHMMADLNESNRRLADQRRAMLHILADYEKDRTRLARQSERLDNSRRALLHILQDSHDSNLRLEDSRKAMIHIMGDLRDTTEEIGRREQELRDKQEQLVQAGKMATLGELTTGVAHELNNPLNNIGLFVGNVIDHVRMKQVDEERILHDLGKVVDQVKKATQIISHLRTFGRAASISIEPVGLEEVIESSLLLVHEQLRLRQIEVRIEPFPSPKPIVLGNPIQLEQAFINLLTNARDALENASTKRVVIECSVERGTAIVIVRDTGTGIPAGLEQRIFDPFFTTKEVGSGTGLGLSITYSIIKDHFGTIAVEDHGGVGAAFRIELPLAEKHAPTH